MSLNGWEAIDHEPTSIDCASERKRQHKYEQCGAENAAVHTDYTIMLCSVD